MSIQKKDKMDTFGAVSLVTFSALLGLNQVLIKLVNEGLNPVFQAGLRSLCAIPIVVAYCYFTKKKMSFGDGTLLPGLLCGLCFAGEFIMLFLAIDFTTVARVSIFFYTMPFWVAIAAHFLIDGEQLNYTKIAGLVIAFSGVIIALVNNAQPASDNAFVGDILCLVAASLWAAIAIIARTTKLNKSTPEMQLVYQLIVSAPIILICAPLFGEAIRNFMPHHAAIFTFQVVVVVSFGFSFWFWLLAKYPAPAMASFSFLAPVFGVLFGWLILNENIDSFIIIALIMVASGIFLVNTKS